MPATSPRGAPPKPSPLHFAASALAIARVHTALSALAFATALALGLSFHYHRIVKNQYFAYPDEWFPSVSATIGDWYPERNVFQLLIALTSGPRFLLVLLAYLSHAQLRPRSALPGVLAGVAVLRTLACGGWVYVTSSDHGDAHDVLMVSYIVLNLPYMILHTLFTAPSTRSKTLRRLLGTSFFATLVPLVYFYLQHKVHQVAGAYSIYALFEWALIILDVSFDSVFILDYEDASVPPLSLEVRTEGDDMANGVSQARPPTDVEQAFAKVEMGTASARHFLSDVYLSFLWFTLLTALGPMIFYSSVWAMGLSGDEVLLFCVLSPALLALRPLLRLFTRPEVAHVGLLIGVASRYLSSDDASVHEDDDDQGQRRLRMLAFGLAMATMGHVAEWWQVRLDPARLDQRATTFLLGLVLSVLVKFANFSLNPLWPFLRSTTNEDTENGGWNGVGLVLGVLAYLDACTRRRRPVAGAAEKKEVPQPIPAGAGAGLASIVGFAGLFFLLVLLYTDSGTAIAWSFAGYPSSGPFAFPHGLVMILSLSLGVLFPALFPSLPAALTSSSLALPLFALASLAAALTYSQTSWASFLPACLLGTYTTTLFPPFLRSLVTTHPASPAAAFAGAFTLYGLLVLASTFCVAYAFVPGGNAFRERMDIVLALTMICVGVGLIPLRSSASESTSLESAARGGGGGTGGSRAFRRRVEAAVVAVLVAGAGVVAYRSSGGGVRGVVGPYHPEDRLVTAAIWTVHFGLDGKMWESQRRMAQIIRDAEIDVIGLLETDVHRIVGGNRDITQWISHSLNMPYVDLGPSPHKNTWGCALLSKFPIVRSSHHLLPSPHGELAPAIYATLDVYGTEVDVVVSHNGQEEDPLDRELQSRELARLMSQSWPRPVVFLGYVVTEPHAERPAPYKLLVEDGRMFDVDPTDHDRWCQYILYRGLHRTSYARLNRGSNPSITDTELQLAKFVVPYRDAPGSPWSLRPPSISISLPPPPSSSSSEEEEEDEIASTLIEPAEPAPPQAVPVESYASHLRLTTAPSPLRFPPAGPTSFGTDRSVPVPERYIPSSLRFPDAFKGEGVRGHFYIVLANDDGGEVGARYFMEDELVRRRERDERDRAERALRECTTQ
ncbi:hypothetical protein JCM5296_001596 [Sporobolomyces johnsonii]